MATGTARHGISGTTQSVAEIGPAIGGATPTGGLVVLRDERGILSVMRCLDADLTLDPGFQYGYPAESAAMAGLAEPSVAPPLSYVVDAAGQIVAIVCRHINGVRLSKVLAQLPRGLDVQTAASVVKDVLSALGTLHARGVPHRAPDPDHVIVEPNGNCVLVDIGLVARTAEPDLASDAAADLEMVAELFVACLVPGRLLTERRARPGYFAEGELEGVAARIYDALAEPGGVRDVGTDTADPANADAASAQARPVRAHTAALMSNALEAAAADSFDAGWDGRGRERLAAAARDLRSTRRRFLEFRPTRDTDFRWTLRGWHAASPRVGRSRERLVASADVMRQARTQLAELWSPGVAGEHAGRGHAAGGRGGSGMTRYLIPLIAFLLAFGVALLVLGFTTPAPARVTLTPPPPTQAAASATKITQLYIASLGYDNAQPNKAVAVVDVDTSGTAPASLTVSFDGTLQGATPNDGRQTDRFALSGKTQYIVTDSAYVAQYCSFATRLVTAEVNVTAAVDSEPAALSSASGNLFSKQCS